MMMVIPIPNTKRNKTTLTELSCSSEPSTKPGPTYFSIDIV